MITGEKLKERLQLQMYESASFYCRAAAEERNEVLRAYYEGKRRAFLDVLLMVGADQLYLLRLEEEKEEKRERREGEEGGG